MADGVRLDKWLWAARMFKTRSQASDACGAGHVKLNGDGLKASRDVKVGEVLEVHTAGGKKILLVKAISDQRGAAPVARLLYDDLTPPELPMPRVFRDAGAGRPTKRDRRQMEKILGGRS